MEYTHKGKNLLPKELIPGGKAENGRAASPENISIQHSFFNVLTALQHIQTANTQIHVCLLQSKLVQVLSCLTEFL